KTVLQDNVFKGDASCQGGAGLLAFNVDSPNNFRLTNFTVKGVATDPNFCSKGHIQLDGTAKAFRVDHLTMDPVQTAGIIADGYLWGVIDHITARGNFKNKVRIFHSGWGGSFFGDGSWAESLYLGTEKAIYIEDCFFENTNAGYAQTGALDGYDG